MKQQENKGSQYKGLPTLLHNLHNGPLPFSSLIDGITDVIKYCFLTFLLCARLAVINEELLQWEHLRKYIWLNHPVTNENERSGFPTSYGVPAPLPQMVCCGSVAKSCPTLCNPMDCSPPGSSVHRTPQARILEWVARSNQSLLHRQPDSLLLSHQGMVRGITHCLRCNWEILRGNRQANINNKITKPKK